MPLAFAAYLIQRPYVQPRLLANDEPPAFTLEQPQGTSPYVLTCDHASARLPRALDHLGLTESDLARHIAWDIGVAQVARGLSQRLDATLVLANYSRLAIDPNRPLDSEQSIVRLSERTRIPGNIDLNAAAIAQRQRELFLPYHDCIRQVLDARASAGHPTALCSIHSFTPVYLGQARPWHAGVLYAAEHDTRLSLDMLAALREDGELVVGDNQPYAVSEQSDYTVIVHAHRRGLPYLELEIRQDLIAEPAGQRAWVDRLAQLLPRVWSSLERA
jgi:predicted N-formylglutamate amidohydrolase